METLRLAPPLRSYGLRGGLLSWDGQLVDDARLVTAIARTAAANGARILTRCRALALDGDGAQVRDELTGEEFAVRARAVVNATGVWAGGLATGVRLRPSRGTHLVLRAESVGGLAAGLHLPVPGAPGHYALALPQEDGRVYVGLTDEASDGPIPDVPEPSEAEIGFLLDVLDSALDVPVRRADVAGAYAGLRPLLDTGDGDTADLSRRHAVLTAPNGVVTIVGGKLTTYRRMAQDAVDAVLEARALPAGPCGTARLPLVGAGPDEELARLVAPAHLVRRYGAEAPDVLALAAEDPSLAEPVAPGSATIGAELAWAVRHEGALDEADLLDRRTRVGLISADRDAALAAARHALAHALQT